MVGGLPSKGSGRCRSRRIKCDQIPGGCTQCARLNDICPGYRNYVSLLFRDQTEKFTDSARRQDGALATGSAAAPSLIAASLAPTGHATLDYQVPQLGHRISGLQDIRSSFEGSQRSTVSDFIVPLETVENPEQRSSPRYAYSFPSSPQERAMGFFQSKYLEIGSQSPRVSQEHLLTSMEAVELAGIACNTGSDTYMEKSTVKYVQAVKLLNSALETKDQARRDSTLESVPLLSVYESVAGVTKSSLMSWNTHLQGAAAIIKLRGKAQFLTSRGRRLFLQSLLSLLVVSAIREIPLPEHIMEFRFEIQKYLHDPTFLPWLYQEEFISFTSLLAAIKRKEISDHDDMISRALDIDRRLDEAFTNIQPGWQYKIFFTNSDPQVVLNGYYHVYEECWLSHLWNGMRLIRMVLHQLSTEENEDRLHRYRDQLECSLGILTSMKNDVIASVPQYLGYPSASAIDSFTPQNTETAASSETIGIVTSWVKKPEAFGADAETEAGYGKSPDGQDFQMSGGAFSLIWALYIAGYVPLVSSQKSIEYIIRMLKIVGRSMGVMQAVLLANSLQERQDIKDLCSRGVEDG